MPDVSQAAARLHWRSLASQSTQDNAPPMPGANEGASTRSLTQTVTGAYCVSHASPVKFQVLPHGVQLNPTSQSQISWPQGVTATALLTCALSGVLPRHARCRLPLFQERREPAARHAQCLGAQRWLFKAAVLQHCSPHPGRIALHGADAQCRFTATLLLTACMSLHTSCCALTASGGLVASPLWQQRQAWRWAGHRCHMCGWQGCSAPGSPAVYIRV